ncbi:hypothetical protein GCM10025867_49880 (plasmid) [Frondihabitans sucicola]|uniref:GIY-YIG nuclease family protein n=1 Tax=Frondihabitans sucicola TaxID=1268041 RepID=A0ABM8GW94_9MICO|nr:hypothetical protein [Frondihabitans sucicola]BDZ52747.1 hypothetical protein GCM10025867_49880 [Frondihabitans sucicola]
MASTPTPYPPSWDREGLEALGFEGFVSFGEVRIPRHLVMPNERGIYAVIRPGSQARAFTAETRAKGGAYDLDDLASRWVDASPIVYIGKADPVGGIHKRVKQFGRRGNSHTGGRSIWQLADADELLVAWLPTGEETGRAVEKRWIERFVETFGKRPFANIDD